MHRNTFIAGVAVLSVLVLACNRHSQSPTSPSNASPASSAAEAGVTLKVTPPTLQSPINDARIEGSPTLVATESAVKFTDGLLQYHFQIFNDAGTLVYDSPLVSSTTLGVPAGVTLDYEKRHTWRVRAEFQGAVGPWSAAASFITPAGAYIRGSEIRDPLTGGTTVGTAVRCTFIPGVGVRLDSQNSFVEYVLPVSLTAGEFSAEMTNIGNGSEEWKTKVMSMLQGDGVNVTDNEFRTTLDKRTSWAGQGSRIRYTMRSGGVSPEPSGGPQSWNRSTIYFWKFEWGNGFSRLRVFEGGRNGRLMEDLSASMRGTYRPTPHVIRLGSVGGRGGDDTNPGTTIRNVWVSANPRPVFAGEQ